MMNETTKRFPRSLNEAFRRTPEYGCAITYYPRNRLWAALLRLFGLR
jgi:hypothetical protein